MTDQEKIDVIQAQIDGRAIQSRPRGSARWSCQIFGGWSFDFLSNEYRVYVEPEEKYIELSAVGAFKILSSAGTQGVKAQFADSTGEVLKDSDWKCHSILRGAHFNSYSPSGATYHSERDEWDYCRVTQEVFDAGH